ncbi:MAG TPA: nuclear transport factor 2 family protein [Solirubrobacterales bacterium]|nr:nuclear transport factor 2 family protein [Solirubrobacterales bacterium]
MSRENVEAVRAIYAEWGRGNFRTGSELYDEHVVLVLRPGFADPGVYLGREEIRAYMRGFLVGWAEAAIAGEEFLDAGDTVLVAVHQHATGSGSGAPVEMRYWQAWTFRGGAVIRIESIKERSEALEAAGLRE